jgi:hypothetical protein
MSPRSWISAWILAAQLGFAAAAAGPDFSAEARLWRQQLGERVLPYWFDTVTADGGPKSSGLAHNWKANYHDVRGMLKFVEQFERPASP